MSHHRSQTGPDGLICFQHCSSLGQAVFIHLLESIVSTCSKKTDSSFTERKKKGSKIKLVKDFFLWRIRHSLRSLVHKPYLSLRNAAVIHCVAHWVRWLIIKGVILFFIFKRCLYIVCKPWLKNDQFPTSERHLRNELMEVWISITALSHVRGCWGGRLSILPTEVVQGGVSLDGCWRIHVDYCPSWTLLVSGLSIQSPSDPKFTFSSNLQERLGLTLSAESEM